MALGLFPTSGQVLTGGGLSFQLSPNTDNTLQTGYGMMGFVPSGLTTAFYLAQASNYTNTAYALVQTSGGQTNINCKTGQSLQLCVAGATRGTLAAGSLTFASGVPVTISDTTASALAFGAAGGGVSIKSGTNARCGTATLVAGTVTVSNTSVTANTRVMCTVQAPGGTQGFISTSKVNATSFTITSTSGTETSVVAWELVENP